MSLAAASPHTPFDHPVDILEADEHAACTLIRGAGQMAKLLIATRPSQARRFAATMRERVCAEQDQSAPAFWGLVIELLQPHA